MDLNTLEIRIAGTIARIEKLNKKIDRHWNKIVKLEKANETETDEVQIRYNNMDIEFEESDWERAKKDLKEEQEKLAKYREQKKAAEARELATPIIPAVEDFLANWKSRVAEYYTSEVEQVRPYEKALRENPEFNTTWKRQREMSRRFDSQTLKYSYLTKSEFAEQLEKDLNREVKAKREDLFIRCAEVVGVIEDASQLRAGDNGSINGFVTGENGKAFVETIGAGGYNIQKFHFRVLVKRV